MVTVGENGLDQLQFPPAVCFATQKPVCGARVFLFLGGWEQHGCLKPHTHSGLMGAGRAGQGWGWGRGGMGTDPDTDPGWLCTTSVAGPGSRGSARDLHSQPSLGTKLRGAPGAATSWAPVSEAGPERGPPAPPPAPRAQLAAQLRPRPNPLGRTHW